MTFVPDRPRRADGLRSVELDGETVVFAHDTDRLHLLDTPATLVWSLLDGRPLDDVVAELAARFGVAAADMHRDVTGVVRTMLDGGLLVADDGR